MGVWMNGALRLTVEGAAMGNLLMQAKALGDIENMEELRHVVRRSEKNETFKPRHTEAWDKAYTRMISYMEVR